MKTKEKLQNINKKKNKKKNEPELLPTERIKKEFDETGCYIGKFKRR